MPLSCHSASKLSPICSTCYSLVLFVVAVAMFFWFQQIWVYLLQIKTNMAFAIVSSILAFSLFSVFCVAINYYRNYSICVLVQKYGYRYKGDYDRRYYWDYSCSLPGDSTGIALYATLLIPMIAEFAISLAVAISCCKHGCQCCENSTGASELLHNYNFSSISILRL